MSGVGSMAGWFPPVLLRGVVVKVGTWLSRFRCDPTAAAAGTETRKKLLGT